MPRRVPRALHVPAWTSIDVRDAVATHDVVAVRLCLAGCAAHQPFHSRRSARLARARGVAAGQHRGVRPVRLDRDGDHHGTTIATGTRTPRAGPVLPPRRRLEAQSPHRDCRRGDGGRLDESPRWFDPATGAGTVSDRPDPAFAGAPAPAPDAHRQYPRHAGHMADENGSRWTRMG